MLHLAIIVAKRNPGVASCGAREIGGGGERSWGDPLPRAVERGGDGSSVARVIERRGR